MALAKARAKTVFGHLNQSSANTTKSMGNVKYYNAIYYKKENGKQRMKYSYNLVIYLVSPLKLDISHCWVN